MPLRLITILPFIFALFWVESHAGEMIYPLITYKCDPGTDTAVVTNSLIKDGNAANYKYSDEDGTYSPWDLVEIERANDKSRIVKTSKLAKTCKLSSGEYTFTIEPQLFGRNLEGRCGASISTALTITYDGVDILERTPFENFCHGNAPVVIRVTTFGKTGEVKIKRIPKYRFY